MSTPVMEQPPPPPAEVTQQAYAAHSGHGSFGPVIAVLAVITILGVIAGMIGRLCTGRRIVGRGQYQYDFEGWVERKCSSCIDGNTDPAPRHTTRPEIPVAEPVVAVEGAQPQAQRQPQPQQQQQQQQQQEIKEDEHVQEPVHQESRQAKTES